ncbi:UNVERIFIED_CONTAM: hypothetical protein Sradi_3728500 [Sesamum radiatum]|uniref:Uncharacterized protein n=1 Tax=Sesamum radiatum TaxID=300843 RepID=A0AAW2PY42_SESRA
MAHHARLNGLLSQCHPTVKDFKDNLIRLKCSAEVTSSPASSVCTNLDSLNDFQESINDLTQFPSTKQALTLGQGRSVTLVLLDGPLRLLDFCGIAKDITAIVNEFFQVLESSPRT